MIHLTKGNTDKFVVTLTEKCQLNSPNYLFIFTSREDLSVIKFVLLNASDISTMKQRYNQFQIVVNTYFGSAKTGEYSYSVYEQVSTTNLDPTLSTGLVETGQMTLSDNSEFNFTNYSPSNTFKVREI